MHRIDISRIDLNLLVVFELLLEERHVGRAADRMQLSQSTISHALGRLRRLFNDPLFVRHRAGMEPTPRARELAGPLADALTQVRRVVSPAEFNPATFKRTLNIATHEYAVAVLLTKLLSQLREEAPSVDLRCVGLSYQDLVTAFDRGEIDLGCGAFPGLQSEQIERTPLFEDRFIGVVRAGHPAMTESRMTLAAFCAFPHVLVAIGGQPHDPIGEALRAQGVSRRIALILPSALSVTSIVAEADLVGVLPERLAASMTGNRGLVTFELPVTITPVSCDLLLPTPLARTPEAQWLRRVFQRVAASMTKGSRTESA